MINCSSKQLQQAFPTLQYFTVFWYFTHIIMYISTLFWCLWSARTGIFQDVHSSEFASGVQPVHSASALQSYDDDPFFIAVNVHADVPVKHTF